MKRTLVASLILSLLFPSVATSDHCNLRRQNFSQSYYYAPQYAEVYYFVGQPLRIKALVELEQAEEYAEFKRWKQKQLQPHPTPPSELLKEEIPTARVSLVNNICAKCHSGAAPKAQLSLTHDSFLELDTFKKARNAVLSGEMPKGQKLTDEEKNQVISELSTLLGD